ncbi:hypothetical protein [Caenimonas sp. SL110]|uniref:hypothetical protein n=1 Tax=Caenimonas sp. SL110 TaxID=1450524 RepID=UPI00128C472F|nr:hypothetical protein [Caenimonas sp. SL110]
MSRSTPRLALAACAAVVALAGCGSSGGGDDGGVTTPPPAPTTDIPQSAQSSVDSLIAYISGLISGSTNETGSPVLVGDAVLPVSETAEPSP